MPAPAPALRKLPVTDVLDGDLTLVSKFTEPAASPTVTLTVPATTAPSLPNASVEDPLAAPLLAAAPLPPPTYVGLVKTPASQVVVALAGRVFSSFKAR